MSNSKTYYRITQRFVSGLLDGITITHVTSVPFEVGETYKGTCGTSDYIVLACEVHARDVSAEWSGPAFEVF